MLATPEDLTHLLRVTGIHWHLGAAGGLRFHLGDLTGYCYRDSDVFILRVWDHGTTFYSGRVHEYDIPSAVSVLWGVFLNELGRSGSSGENLNSEKVVYDLSRLLQFRP